MPAVCRYYRDFSKTGLNLLLPYIIRRIMEIQIAVFGFINRNKCLQRFYLEVLDGRYIRISKFMWENGFDETGTVVPP